MRDQPPTNVNDSVYAPRTTLSGFIFGYLCLYSPVPYNISRFYNDYACSQHLYHQKPRSANYRARALRLPHPPTNAKSQPDARSLRRGPLPRRTDARLVPPHPPVFQGLKSLTLSSPLQTSLLRCAAGRISIYSSHSIAYGVVSTTGLRTWFLGANLTSGRSLTFIPDTIRDEGGEGRRVELEKPVEMSELVSRTKTGLGLSSKCASIARGHAA
ncbi:hypothetical protein C8F01DRAFT_645505 [Mycena amicta]|nr:hypothetical protein C8F01DRAFT_645489 [Mycena amicta]KAJ7051279.1 hypothetical protein C8F01DRAFT_645505 [Mycena amicta]